MKLTHKILNEEWVTDYEETFGVSVEEEFKKQEEYARSYDPKGEARRAEAKVNLMKRPSYAMPPRRYND